MTTPVPPSVLRLDDPSHVWEDRHAKSISFFCHRAPIRVDAALLDQLKDVARRAAPKNARICLHPGPDAAFHEMIIFERRGGYLRPHKHAAKGESYHVVEGAMGAFIFDHTGRVLDACQVGEGGAVAYRVGADMFHAVMPLTEYVIYHEAKPGPFLGVNDSIYPEWAPDGTDIDAVAGFQRRLLEALANDAGQR